MPYLTPEELVTALAETYYSPAQGEPIYHRLIAKLESAEMLDFIKIKKTVLNMRSARRNEEFTSLFGALVYCYGYSHAYHLRSLKLFFDKLDQALKSLDQTDENKKLLAEFLESLNDTDVYGRNILSYIGTLATRSKDPELLQKFIRVIGVSALDKAVRNPVNHTGKGLLTQTYNAPAILDYISDAAFNEIMLIPEVRRQMVQSRDTVLLALVRANGDTFNHLIEDVNFLDCAMTHLHVTELQALVFEKMNNHRLNQIIPTLIAAPMRIKSWDTLPLLLKEQGAAIFDTIIRRGSPFILQATIVPMLNAQLQDYQEISLNYPYRLPASKLDPIKGLIKKCDTILGFISKPGDAITKNKPAFLDFLTFHLNSKDQIIVDAPKWLSLLQEAKKACKDTDLATLALLNGYIWKLQKRPDCSSAVKDTFSAQQTQWIDMKETGAAKRPSQPVTAASPANRL